MKVVMTVGALVKTVLLLGLLVALVVLVAFASIGQPGSTGLASEGAAESSIV